MFYVLKIQVDSLCPMAWWSKTSVGTAQGKLPQIFEASFIFSFPSTIP